MLLVVPQLSASASARTISVRVTQCAQAEHGPPATGIPASDPFQKRQGGDLAPALELGKVQAVQGLQRCCPRSPPPSEGAPPPARRSRQLPRCVSWPECSRAQPCTLTVKLSGRTQAPDQSRGRTMSSRAHGDTTELHGPLQRLLDVAQALFLCLAMSSRTVGTSSAGTSITVEAESAASSSATASSSVCDS